ncbi:transglutaminase-like cysteine peptidase [Consotaella sp. CSK11QG-6]
MTIGGDVKPPLGHRLFCQVNPSECIATGPESNPIKLDTELMRTVAAINTRTNATIEAKSDREIFGVREYWAYPDREGDCEDFVLLKRRKLHEAGIPLSDLLITVVRRPNGEGHAVLTLRAQQGDFILDNLDWQIKPWTETPYTYLKRQSSVDPARWQSVQTGPEVLVGAVDK